MNSEENHTKDTLDSTKVVLDKAANPGEQVLRRLLKNKLTLLGVFFICLSIIIALLGYHIMPDDTRLANDGAVEIPLLESGATVKFLKVRKNQDIPEQSLLARIFQGKERYYTIVPINSYEVVGGEVIIDHIKPKLRKSRHRDGAEDDHKKTFALLNVVKPLAIGEHMDQEIKDENQQFSFSTVTGKTETTSLTELKEEFEKNNIVERTYWLGTDKSGRDVLSMLILGTRVSLGIGFIAVIISISIGVLMGALAGFFGGWVDDVIQWIITVVWSIPGIMMVIAISLALNSKGIWVAFVAVGLIMWVEVARVVRGELLSIKQKNYIESARALGYGNTRIILGHMLPNILGSIIVIANANFASAILLEASLSFLGLGVQPPTPSWGMMVKAGYDIIGAKTGMGLIIYPAICIMIMVLSFNLLGNGLRDAYDPKSH